MKSLLLIGMILLPHNEALAAKEPRLVRVPVSTVFAPQGFDTNDRAQVVIEGYFPNTCYRIGPTKTSVDPKTGTVQIEQWAYLYDFMCAQMIVPYEREVTLGLLKSGNHDVQEASQNVPLGRLPIHQAEETAPDEFLYAPVKDAYLLPERSGPRMVRVEGSFPSTCYQMKEIRVVEESESVITLLPVMERIPNSPCLRRYHPFAEDVALPYLGNGRHLLHVRSLNGEAVNKLFDIYPKLRR